MDTGLVEGYVFLAEILYMFGEERQHVRLAVIRLFAERLELLCLFKVGLLQMLSRFNLHGIRLAFGPFFTTN